MTRILLTLGALLALGGAAHGAAATHPAPAWLPWTSWCPRPVSTYRGTKDGQPSREVMTCARPRTR